MSVYTNRARSVLRDLVIQIERSDPADSNGHPLVMNRAFVEAKRLLALPEPFRVWPGVLLPTTSPGQEHRTIDMRITMPNRYQDMPFNEEVVSILRAYCQAVERDEAGKYDTETMILHGDAGDALVEVKARTQGTIAIEDPAPPAAQQPDTISNGPIAGMATSADAIGLTIKDAVARGDYPPKQTFELLDQVGASGGIVAAAIERLRQVVVEGFTEGHDNAHYGGEMRMAAAVYAMPPNFRSMRGWPWALNWFKPGDNATIAGRKRDCEKAMALLAAEWDRLDRAERRPVPTEGESA